MGWKNYVLKLAILGRVPFGNLFRRIKRRLVGYLPDEGNLLNTLSNFEGMKNAVQGIGRTFADSTVLEIGTGWFPIIPIMLSAVGTRKVLLTDLVPHMDDSTFGTTLDFLKPHLKAYPEIVDKSTMEEFPFEYIAPFQFDRVPDGTIDFIVSRAVLEHIPTNELQNLLVQMRPKLAPSGLMIHCIDHSDHLEHRDKSISKINFLTWSERQHKFVNWLTKEGENRLRHHEYRKLFEKSGYEVVFELGTPHPSTVEWAKKLPLKDRFVQMTPDEIAILSSIYILSPRVEA